MGLFDQFPYTNFHNLNLDWIIGQIKNIKSAVTSTAEDAASASHSAEAAAASAGSAAGSAAYAGNAAALVQQVRDDLDTVNTEMTNFVQAHSGLSNETVLWTGTASATGDTITLSDDIRNYKYIDVQATYKGAVSSSNLGTFYSNVVRFTPAMFTDDNAVLNIPYAYNDQLQICTVFMFWDSLDPTDYTKISLGYTRRVSINDHGTLDNAADPGTVIVKIVGVKNIADAEVIDARVGEDDTVYSTLKQRLDAEYSELKSTISGGGLTEEAKQALLACFENAAWIGNDGQAYYDALEVALYPPANLVSISAVYTQRGTVYDTDSLDSLKADLVVTALYSDSTTATVTTYTLSGTLTAGTSTITASYGGKTTTFNVTVTETGVPAEYQEVEYLLNTLVDKDNGAYLNTGVTLNSPTTAKVEIGYENIQFTNESTCYPVGTRKNNTGTTNDVGWGLSISTNQSTGHGSWSGGPGAYAVPVSHYGRHDAIATWSSSAVSLKLDELNLVTSTQTTRAIGSYPIGLLGVPSNTGNGATFMMNGKLFYAKIYADDVLLFNGIPCYRKSDNAPGIYDTVNDSFITASAAGNTGSVNCITAGPAV